LPENKVSAVLGGFRNFNTYVVGRRIRARSLQAAKPKGCVTEWQQRLKLVYDMAGIPDGHSHWLQDTFSVDLLSKGVPIDVVPMLLGHTSIKTTEKHYAPWVQARQTALEAAVKGIW